MLECRMDFLVNRFICLCKISSSLGMSNNDVIHTKILQHHTTDFSGVSTIVLPMEILSAYFYRSTLHSLYQCWKVSIWCTDHTHYTSNLCRRLHFLDKLK